MDNSTPAQYALILIDLALEAGVDREALLQGSGLASDASGTIGARIPGPVFRALAENALRLTGDPALGLHLGVRLNLSAHAVLGQAFMTCRNLGEVLQLFERYYPVLAPDLELQFGVRDGRMRITSTNTQADLPITFGLEVIAGAIRNTLGGLLAEQDFPIRYDFPYPAPEYVEQYYAILGGDMHFDCHIAAWSFPESLVHLALPSSNPALRQLYEAECARLLADLAQVDDLATQTRRLLRKFEGQYPQMPQVAAMLNVSSRTYRRRLAETGTSFQALLDSVRAEHATRYLRETPMSIASIAYRLGFNDPSNFRCAYRRWTGNTPSAVRRMETSA